MLTWLIIGGLVGTIMGLTGAGGAILSVPLFIWMGLDVYQATSYALFAVWSGASMNALAQRREIVPQFSLLLSLFAGIGAWLSTPLKAQTPPWVIVLLFSSVALYGLRVAWTPKKAKRKQKIPSIEGRYWLLYAAMGLLLGCLITMTGLGGGIVLVPILVSLGFPQKKAVPTSLLTTTISSSISILLQSKTMNIEEQNILLLIAGVILMAWVTKHFLKRVSTQLALRTRQIALTIVILLAVSRMMTQIA